MTKPDLVPTSNLENQFGFKTMYGLGKLQRTKSSLDLNTMYGLEKT
jgi:hypothetical protein